MFNKYIKDRVATGLGKKKMQKYLNILRSVAKKRLIRLQRLMEHTQLQAVILFEGDPIAYKLASTRHFNIVLATQTEMYVLADISLYDEAGAETPWDTILIENLTPGILAERIQSLLPREHPGRIGVNKAWGRGKLTYLYVDLLETLSAKHLEIVDATPTLAQAFDKPYPEETRIIEWISEVTSNALEAAQEALKPGMHEYELAAMIEKALDWNGIVDRWFTTIVASGPRTATPHAKTMRTGRIAYIRMRDNYLGAQAWLEAWL